MLLTLLQEIRVSASGTQKAVNPALVDYLLQFVYRWHHEGNFQSLKLKMGKFLQSKEARQAKKGCKLSWHTHECWHAQ